MSKGDKNNNNKSYFEAVVTFVIKLVEGISTLCALKPSWS